jgi:hypothetical protein
MTVDAGAQIFQALGRLQGDVDAVLRGQEELAVRLDRHFEDDKRLADRVGAIEIEQARFAGAEASRTRRNAGIASVIGTITGVAGAIFGHWVSGGH